MKNSYYPKSISLVRKLKPKLTRSTRAILIQDITFNNEQEGQTFIKIYPSRVSISSKDLIQMIEAKKESIPLENNDCILRKDILLAIQNYPWGQENQNQGGNHNINSSTTTSASEPKRPTNAFILYRSALRKKIKTLFPSFNNSDISKFIGAMWKAANKEVKEKYIKQASECRILHKQRYPNFEYNIKKENVENAASNSEQYSISSDDWESYFDWCIQNATVAAVDNGIRANDDSRNTLHPFWHTVDSNAITGSLDPNGLLMSEYQRLDEWSEVCNIVAEFFPEDSDQNALIDDKLWTSLGGIDLVANYNFESAPNFEDTVIGSSGESM